MQNPQRIQEWLNKRTLRDETIERFHLHWNEREEIVIPIYDKDGKFLFNKYRRNPFSTDTEKPKYRYEKGAKSVLYNLETLKDAKPDEKIYITEGELDCIAVENAGFKAVTTTGGAGTFEPEWADELKNFKNISICFDSDVAGINGAIYVLSLLPHAKIVELPYRIKDLTEFFQAGGDLSTLKEENYLIPSDLKDKRDKDEVKKKMEEFKSVCDIMQAKRREVMNKKQPVLTVDKILEYVSNRYALYSRTYKNLVRRPFRGDGDKVRQAKLVPITNYVNFNNQGYACCLWHDEDSASMYYNNEHSKFPNTVKCFGCGQMSDTIDVIMQLHNLSFQESVNFILNK